MSELNASNLRKEHGNEGPDLVGVTELTSPYYMVPPSGTTAERPQNPQKGTLRFNTDIGSLEFYRGDTIGWESIDRHSSAPLGARGIFAGGNSPSRLQTIDYITVATTGNAADFGDLSTVRDVPAGAANTTRGVIAGGYQTGTGDLSSVDQVTIATLGNGTSWGSLSSARRNRDGCGDYSRGLFMSGYPTTAQIDYLTFMSTGTSIDFGDTTQSRYDTANLSDATRAVCCGGNSPSTNICDYVTIQSTGNAQDFGDLVTASTGSCGHSSSTRGIISMAGTEVNYITIATLGNAADFGDVHNGNGPMATGSSTRCCIAGGYTPTVVNTIQYVTMTTLGNGTDFGDLTGVRTQGATFSNSGGGL